MKLAPDGQTLHVTLQARPFEIRFPQSPDTPYYRVTFWTDDTIFRATPLRRTVDDEKSAFTYFNKYGVIIDEEGGSGRLFVTHEGHQAFDNTRIARSDRGYSETIKTIEDWDQPIYAVAWFDLNGDGIVDPGEVEQFVLDFT